MYWEIIPYHNHDKDVCVMPGDTENEHREALGYAYSRLEAQWDQLKPGQSAKVEILLCDGEMPKEEDL